MPSKLAFSENEKILRAALYIRVSSEEQAMHGLSLAAQRSTLETYAKKHGYKVVDLYADEGTTARKKYRNRKGFMRMLDDVQTGKIDIILFIKLDRWFRNVGDYYEVQRILETHGVQWDATEEQYDTTTANGRLNLNIRLSIAQDESDRTGERIKFVFEDKLRRGEVISGKVPFGYKIQAKKLVRDPEAAAAAQKIFQHYVDVRSLRDTRKYVLENFDRYYTTSGMRAFLRNERYIGHAHGDENFCEPIIEPDVFYLTQKILDQRAQRRVSDNPEHIYLFSGIAYCAECGNKLCGHVVSHTYIYYRCPKYYQLKHCCHKKNTSETKLEQWMLSNLGTQFAAYNARIQEMRERAKAKPIDRERIKSKMAKLRQLYLNDLIELEDYESEYQSLKEKLSHEDAPIPQMADTSWLKNLNSIYSQLDRPHQKAFWSRLVGRIEIDDHDHVSVYPARFLSIDN